MSSTFAEDFLLPAPNFKGIAFTLERFLRMSRVSQKPSYFIEPMCMTDGLSSFCECASVHEAALSRMSGGVAPKLTKTSEEWAAERAVEAEDPSARKCVRKPKGAMNVGIGMPE